MYLHININSTALLILNQHESNMETNCTNLQFTWLKNTDITFTANNIIWSSEETVTIHFQAVTDGVTNVRAVNLANVWNLRRRNRSWAPPTGCFMYSFSRTPLMQVSVFLPKNYLSVLLSHTHKKKSYPAITGAFLLITRCFLVVMRKLDGCHAHHLWPRGTAHTSCWTIPCATLGSMI